MSETFKIIVAGSRDFNNYDLLEKTLLEYFKQNQISLDDVCIVSGHARGADKLGELFALRHNVSLQVFPADWNTYGKRVGYIRNTEMTKYANICFCFWNGQSRGTKHMIDIATDKSLLVNVIQYK